LTSKKLLPAARDAEYWYRTYRPFVFSVAYRMLGAVSDAEDAVHDLFADIRPEELANVRNPKAYLAKWTINRCLNVLRSARRKREVYIGEWLPEPLLERFDGPDLAAERKETLSYAYLVMLERLTPAQRAVFLLREAFEYDYEAIAELLGKSEANCRKLFSRAKKSMNAVPSSAGAQNVRKPLLEKFVSAFQQYDVERLLELLAEDATMVTDGGGNVHAAIRPIIGRKRVLALLSSPKAYTLLRKWDFSITEINKETNVAFSQEGVVKGVLCFELSGEQNRIRNLYLILNPDKLKAALSEGEAH
jgi:RNA polymerase sigma-70 factor (ECF subfamily)